MQYVSHSSYLVSIEAIARLIYIYETTLKQIFLRQIVLKAVSEHKNTKDFLGGMPPDPSRGVGNN